MNPAPSATSSSTALETYSYDNAIVRSFIIATLVWGVIGMLVGVIVALQMAWPAANFGLPWLSNGRLRPLHTNANIQVSDLMGGKFLSHAVLLSPTTRWLCILPRRGEKPLQALFVIVLHFLCLTLLHLPL
jgi:cbb3-type cytochrome oxidase subunit 1